MRNLFASTTTVALLVATAALAQTPNPTTVPVGNQGPTTNINIIGVGTQQTNVVWSNGALTNPLSATTFVNGMQSSAGSINLGAAGTNASGASGKIFSEGYVEGTGNLRGDGKTGIGSSFSGRLENYVTANVNVETGKLTMGTDKGPGIQISGNGTLAGGSAAILGTTLKATEADVKAALDKDPKSTLKVGDIIGLQNGGFAANNVSGSFTFEGKGFNPNSSGVTWTGGGSIKVDGSSYVNALPNGFFSGSSSTVVITVPTNPTAIGVPTK